MLVDIHLELGAFLGLYTSVATPRPGVRVEPRRWRQTRRYDSFWERWRRQRAR